jgi:hypothetical protein
MVRLADSVELIAVTATLAKINPASPAVLADGSSAATH